MTDTTAALASTFRPTVAGAPHVAPVPMASPVAG